MAVLRFAIDTRRLFPFLGYHHFLIMITLGAIVSLCVLLAGCSSSATMTSVYPLGLSYINASDNENQWQTALNLSSTLASIKGSVLLEARVGYFGICARQASMIWICWANAEGIRDQIGMQNDPLNLLEIASRFKNDVLFSGLLFMSIVLGFLAILLLSTFPGWHEDKDAATGSVVDVKPFPSRPVSQVALAFLFVAAMLSLISSLWQHIGAVAAAAIAEGTGYGNIRATIGPAAVVLGWFSFTALVVSFVGLLTMILSIMFLDRLTNND